MPRGNSLRRKGVVFSTGRQVLDLKSEVADRMSSSGERALQTHSCSEWFEWQPLPGFEREPMGSSRSYALGPWRRRCRPGFLGGQRGDETQLIKQEEQAQKCNRPSTVHRPAYEETAH